MAITDEAAKDWAKKLIEEHNREYEYSLVYENEDIVDEFPDDEDWIKIHDLMYNANITISFD